ncbi:MAG: DVUA0089 family protein [Alphaproteobacteria bacterium]|nr:DVUA0089 family protein [Alphaproteobacteria bacterium]
MVRWQRLGAVILMVLFGAQARAANFSFTGSFANDTDLQYFTFTLANPTAGVALRTWSYAGGTNAAGQVIPSGGFEPYLNLYFSDGTQMNPGSSGPCAAPPTGNPVADLLPDPTTGACGDVYYPTEISFPGGTWAAGTYTVVLSLFANPGIGNLSDGFFAEVVLAPSYGLTVPGNFTCMEGSPGYQGTPPTAPVDGAFCDQFVSGVQRTGLWALDILNVDSATGPTSIPEPSTLALWLLGAAFLVRRGLRAAC